MTEAEKELKKMVEAFDAGGPKDEHEKNQRKLERLIPHPKMQKILEKVMRGE